MSLQISSYKSMLDARNKFSKGILERLLYLGSRSWIMNLKLVLMLIYTVKINNRSAMLRWHKCNGEMENLFFAYDGQSYCRLVIMKK